MKLFRGISGYVGIVSLGLLGAACGNGSGNADAEPAPGVVSELRSSAKRERAPVSEAARASKSEQAFGLALLQQLEADKNQAFSPHSLSTAFAMVTDAAAGQTLSEVEQVLAFGEVDEDFHRSQDALNLGLAERNRDAIANEQQQVDAQILSESNDLWIRDDAPPAASYLDTLATFYGARAHSADFGHEPEAVRLAINDKVTTDTHELIQELIPEGALSTLTVAVLTNALYFKAPWANRFAAPTPGDFYGLDGTAKRTEMLTAEAGFGYAEGDGFVSVAVPYYGDELEMLLVVPDADAYERVRAGLSGEALANLVASRTTQRIALTLPKFSLGSNLPAVKVLKAMGMETPFIEGGADFPKLKSELFNQVYISDVLHQATVAIDEKGTEASAATAIIFSGVSSVMEPPEPKVVTVDRPFFFIIRDNPTGSVLFVGQVVSP